MLLENNKILGIDLDGNVFYYASKNISEENAEDNIDDKNDITGRSIELLKLLSY